MNRGRARFQIALALFALMVSLLDFVGWWQWRSIAAKMSREAEGGARLLAESHLLAIPSAVERSRRMAPRDLAMASRESVVSALARIGVLQTKYLPANAVGFTNLAREALLRDQTGKATDLIVESVTRNPTSPYLHRVKALVALYIGDLESAVEDLAIAEALAPGMRSPPVELAPEDERLVRLRGLGLRREFYPRKAADSALALAREYRRYGDTQTALEELAEFRDHPSVEMELARWDVEEGEFTRARERLVRITDKKVYPRRVRARAWTMIAVALDYEGDGQGALDAANTALGLDPTSTGPYVTLAGLAQKRGDFDGALAYLRKAWGMKPLDSGLLVRIAGVAERAGKEGDALLALGRAVEIKPEEPDLWVRLVGLQIRSGRLSEAAMTLSRALDRFPTDDRLLRAAEQFRRDVGVR